MSATFYIRTEGFDRTRNALLQMSRPDQLVDLLENIGALVESQTRRRIQEEKSGPDGKGWQAWSDRYARNRPGGRSLLQSEGGLLDSIQYLVTGGDVEVGSNLIYAATQQYGDTARSIPARPFLGISDENKGEIDELLQDHYRDLLD